MTKTELIGNVAQIADLTKTEASLAVNAVLDTIENTLKDGENVALPGFGTFSVKDRAERKGRNPQTGEEITIPAGKVVKFKAGKNLRNIQ
ncbi:MAG: HU family DNA-binding protein [Deltaproteobacteria bacterium]|nr:HU family DNA-binding protein [Deltaproteobacteria bacterium]